MHSSILLELKDYLTKDLAMLKAWVLEATEVSLHSG